MTNLIRIGALALAALLAGCGSDDDAPLASRTGTLSVALTDAPACGFEEVNVTIEKVRVNPSMQASEEATGWSELVLDPPLQVNLLELQNGDFVTLGSIQIPEGVYRQIRLVLAEGTLPGGAPANSVLPIGAAQEIALTTPSAQQSGLKINHEFFVDAQQTFPLLIDFDACKSVVRAGNSGMYILKPVLSVLPFNDTAVSGSLGPTGAGAAVTLQTNATDGSGEPVVVRSTTADADGDYVLARIPPSPAGGYTVVVSGPDLATHVVTGVVVGLDETTALPAFVPAASAAEVLSGTVIVPAIADAEDALVRTMQTVAPATTVETGFAVPDADTGEYAITLATGVPRVAAYDPGLLTFVNGSNAGIYEVQAELPEFDPQSLQVDLGLGPATDVDFQFFASAPP